MIKLFENYSTDLKLGLLKKVEKFLYEIKGDHNVKFNLSKIKRMLFIKVYNTQSRCIFQLNFSKTEFWFRYGGDVIYNKVLSNYLDMIISPYFSEENKRSEGNGKYIIFTTKFLTQEILDKINFNKVDYEEFMDSERFGL